MRQTIMVLVNESLCSKILPVWAKEVPAKQGLGVESDMLDATIFNYFEALSIDIARVAK